MGNIQKMLGHEIEVPENMEYNSEVIVKNFIRSDNQNIVKLAMYPKDSETYFEVNYQSFKLVRTTKSGSLSDVQKVFDDIKTKVQTFAHPALINIHGYKVQEVSDKLFANYRLVTYADWSFQTLKELMEQKQMSGDLFEDTEILQLMDYTISAYSFLQEKQIYCGNISASNIYCVTLPNKLNVFKVCDPYFSLAPYLNVHKYFENQRFLYSKLVKDYYLSPKQFESLSMKNKFPKQDVHKTDTFCLGLVILSAMLLTNVHNIYNTKNLTINTEQLEQYLSEVEDYYNYNLCKILKMMLQYQEEERADFKQVDEHLTSLFRDQRISKRLQFENYIYTKSFAQNQTQQEDNEENEQLDDSQVINHEKVQKKDTQVRTVRSNFKFLFDKGFYPKELQDNRKVQLTKTMTIFDNQALSKKDLPMHYKENPKPMEIRFVCLNDDYGYTYMGYELNYKKHGKGIILSPQNMKIVEGEFFQNDLFGFARVWNEQALVSGQLKSQEMHCINHEKIDFSNLYWIQFEGQFANSIRQGPGHIQFINANTFSGEFYDDDANGTGVYTYANGIVVKGVWKDGIYLNFL